MGPVAKDAVEMDTDPLIVNPQLGYCVQRRVTSDVTRKLFGLSWEETVARVHRHTVSVQMWLSSRAPQGAILRGLGVTATSTGIRESLLNLAHDASFPPGTPPEGIEAEIDRIMAFFHERGVPFLWWLSPMASPADMGERLIQHGMVLLDYRLPALAAPLPVSTNGPVFDPGIEVWQANGRADLQASSAIRHAAFHFPEDAARTYFEDMEEDWLRSDPARLFLARLGRDGPPVAIGALVMGEGLPGVYAMASLPHWEGRGLGKAILARILETARSEGHKMIILTAGARAYSLYRKFGFQHIFEYRLYESH